LPRAKQDKLAFGGMFRNLQRMIVQPLLKLNITLLISMLKGYDFYRTPQMFLT